MSTPSPFHVGAHVVLAVPDRFIQDRHHVVPDETVGRIVGRQGDKWVVNWGIADVDAQCEDYQLDPAPAVAPLVPEETGPPASPTRSQILIDSHMGMTFLVANDDERDPAEFEREALPTDLQWAMPIARGQVYAPTLEAADFTDIAREALAAGYAFRFDVEYAEVASSFLATLVDLLSELVSQGREEQAAAILDAHGAHVTRIALTKAGTVAVVTDHGGYISTSDDAFREVFLPRWIRAYPDEPSRSGRRLLRKTRAALAAGKDAFVED
jgi:hypothetical protein